MTETLLAARVVTATEVHSPGWISIDRERITGVGAGLPSVRDGEVHDLGDVTVVPGFVDTHVHGGGGAGYTGVGNEVSLRQAALIARDAHLQHGTTATMASLVTMDAEALLHGVRGLTELVREGVLGGIHLEGPWLSRARAGAHAVSQLRDPDPAEIAALLAAGDGAIAMVTIAPELPGAIDAIEQLTAAGVVVAIGHSDADYETVVNAIAAGARVATHLFNAMRPLDHREPGPVLALMEDPRVALELIADGTHLHPSVLGWVEAAAGVDRVLLVSDAMDAAGCGDGEYKLGELDVEVRDGVARLCGDDTIAGSTATMDLLFRARAESGGWSSDALLAAVRETATNPARALSWGNEGDIAVDKHASMVVFDRSRVVSGVMRRGEWVREPESN
ncbi:N-acetylglucosamine-6-phosphate deacetylase [Leucobacter viscericola]|uniref:N-acetylglucosamine-6-phosphate deacetylase n=1 Tax=Leucobacter viscericola TaxID=2714935 RepID=A0A6G7XH75_9MICO|nr:N-acetylglucosamine-6-phosphate deacetylase [Leucobacter viscericola]QIK63915.1 N-acetylglucosamine-6-phosphate deacetylase [Leucobacter viscericola]